MRFMLRCVPIAGLTACLPLPTMAHVVLAELKAPSGSYYAGFFRVSHGCGPSDTVSVRISMPESLLSARPQPKAGWTVKVEHAPLDMPRRGEGGAIIKDRVMAITWTGRLPADQFDQFGVMMKLPGNIGSLYFPTVQTCVSGENRWVNIPASGQAWHDVENPAPVIELTAPDDAHEHH